jgi:hypothetical protein
MAIVVALIACCSTLVGGFLSLPVIDRGQRLVVGMAA